MKRKLGTIVLALIILSGIILAQGAPPALADDSDYKILGSIGGPTSAVAVSGSHVYVGKGTSVIVLENSGGSLRQVGQQFGLPSFVSDLKAQGETLYAAAGSAGLYIIDISDPLKPTEKGVYTSTGFAESLDVKGTTVYLANGIEGLQIIDVSDPANPAALGQAFRGKYAFGVSVEGNNAYIAAADDGLLTVDISEPTAPRELASIDTPGVARNVVLSGEYAYVADDWKGISVINISDPMVPKSSKIINTAGRAHGLALDKNYLYVADAYMGLRVFDISNLYAPKDLTSFVPADSQMIRVIAGNGVIYCVDRENGVLCFDTGRLPDLKLKSFYSHTIPVPLFMPADIADEKHGKDIARLLTLGIADKYPDGTVRPQNLITRAEFAAALCKALNVKTTTGYIETAINLGLIKNRNTYVTNAEAIAAMLHMVNLEPKSVNSYMKSGDKYGMAPYIEGSLGKNIRRGNAFAMLFKVIAEIPDAKTHTTLLQSKSSIFLQAFPMTGVEVAAKGGYVFVASGTAGVSVIDASNPANMQQVAHLDFPEAIIRILINGNYAYAFANYSIYVVDIYDPLHPFRTSVVETSFAGPPRGITMDSGKMYIADEWGFHIFSLKNEARPAFLKFLHLMKEETGNNNCTSDISARGGVVYIAMERDGTLIYDVTDVSNIQYVGKVTGSEDFSSNIQFDGKYGLNKFGDTIDILDLTDIRKPERTGSITGTSSAQFNYRIGMLGNYAILPNGMNGVMLADISDPSDINNIQTLDTVGIPVNVSVEGGNIYLADSIGGLCVISRANGGQPAARHETARMVSPPADAVAYQADLFKALPAEKYVLNTEKTLAALENKTTQFTQTLTVTNTSDSGKGSLRWCLQNIRKGGRILFNTAVFKPLMPATIYIRQGLSFSTGSVTVDASNAGVIIDGGKSPDVQTGLTVNTDGNTIKGLKIRNFRWCLALVTGRGNIIGGSRTKGVGPSGEGNILVNGGSLMVSGMNATDNIIVGNNVGIDTDGITPAGTWLGIELKDCSSRTVVGLDRAEYRNITSCNQDKGIMIRNGSFGNLIEGNYVGTDASGVKAAGNLQHGISFELGGYGSIVRNNISCGNGRVGILIFDNGGSFNVLIGNSVGIGADGATRIPNSENPISMGGGVGGGSYFNVFGGRDEELKNRMGGDYNALNILVEGIYDTVFDGRVCKYKGMEKY